MEIGKKITDEDFLLLCKEFDIEEKLIKTVINVETVGYGFYKKDKKIPIVRFENHIFDKLTKSKYRKSNPELTTPYWIKNYNLKGVSEYDRLNKAFELDEKCALLSTSWGLAQIMGFNYKLCGYRTIEDFCRAMFTSEYLQLKAMLTYLTETNIINNLKQKDWITFAKLYNGKNYEENKYPEKMKSYYFNN